ncbi:Serine-threonine/tyrosine-protein kinase catalytic domain [Arabidopsis thaliana x Arabidopsis arenosa]|uniref:Serine-threonine/tyrosine-protein kinase catalytic domain n=1 Tax=Arabidopsis thaliana x Arabidopsis arenosa TaxID=1240361 RepID=A0A8T2E6Z5_9BRAS|nr:Serine-threonine/tyrosine-protein kinase catalytic domain [Arabidopsis thaliana x Arabidopsis arenosa]
MHFKIVGLRIFWFDPVYSRGQRINHDKVYPRHICLNFVSALIGRVTTKADVYSFGVILMELVTSKEALDKKRSDAEHHIPKNRNIIDDVARLAIHCCAKELTQRPEMRYVVSTLTSLCDTWKPSEIVDNDREDTSVLELVKRWKEQEMEGSSSGIIVV